MRKKKPFKLLLLSAFSLVLDLYLIFNFSPSFQFSLPIIGLQFSILTFVLILLFLFIYFLFSFLFNNKRRGLFIAVFVLGYLILKLLNLTHPFFIILLLILLIMLELLFAKRK